MRSPLLLAICAIGLAWVARIALLVDNDFGVYTIMVFGSGFITSMLFEEMLKIAKNDWRIPFEDVHKEESA